MLRQLTSAVLPRWLERPRRSAAPVQATGRRMVMLLAISQTAGYGVLYYSFSVFLAPMAATMRASTTAVTGVLTASLLAAAVTAVPVGRWLDCHGGRAVMTTGSLAASVLVLAWSQVRTLEELYAVWIGIGIASAAVLYEAAFAVVVSWFDPPRRASALLAVTVVAGFASSIFLPLAGWLNDMHGWRTAVLLLGLIHAALTVPLHALIRTPHGAPVPATRSAAPAHRTALIRHTLRDPAYWLLSAAFVAQAFALYAVSVLLVTVLRTLGHSPEFATSVTALLGVLSVTGRLATTAAAGRWSTAAITAWVFLIQGVGALLLTALGRSPAGAIGCVLAFGLGFGVSTIARPAILAARYSTTVYATLAAITAVPLNLMKALAPLGMAVLWHSAGLDAAMDTVAACCLLGAIGLMAAQWTGSQVRARQDRTRDTIAGDGP